MKVNTYTFVGSWLSTMIKAELFSILDGVGKHMEKATSESWLLSDNLRVGDNDLRKSAHFRRRLGVLGQERSNLLSASFTSDAFIDIDHYMKNMLRKSMESLVNWDEKVGWTDWKTESDKNSKGKKIYGSYCGGPAEK